MSGSKRFAQACPWRTWPLLRKLDHIEQKVDVVHARLARPHGRRACRDAEGVPFVTTYHGIYNERFPGKRRYNFPIHERAG